MFTENGISGIVGFLDLVAVPIKTALVSGPKAPVERNCGSGRKIALVAEAGGVWMEKLLFSGEAAALQTKAIEMIKAGRKLVLEGFPLEDIAAWCANHNYHWRSHKHSSSQNTFILEPGKDSGSDAKKAGAKT
jgi:hypothetical protein